jgi:hypothetical protein
MTRIPDRDGGFRTMSRRRTIPMSNKTPRTWGDIANDIKTVKEILFTVQVALYGLSKIEARFPSVPWSDHAENTLSDSTRGLIKLQHIAKAMVDRLERELPE